MTDGFWYVGSPYAKHPRGTTAAFNAACWITGRLIESRIPAFSPIAHSHSIATAIGLDPLDHNLWIPADAPFMAAAHGLIVCQMPGWKESYGLAHEISVFKRAQKPILYLAPGG